MNAADRHAFADRAAEREIYKANALANGFIFRIKPSMTDGIDWSKEWPGKIISTEMHEDAVYARP